MADSKCPKCGAENQAGASRCAKCGAERAAAGAPAPSQESMYGFDEMNKPPIYWPAAGLGLVMILGLQAVMGLTVIPALAGSILSGRQPNVIGFWAVFIVIGLAIYFAAGFVLGRYSKGYLVREPLIAALVAAVGNGLLERFAFKTGGVTVPMIVVTALICVGVAYLGGMAGEQAQQKERERRRALAALMKK